MKKIIFDTSFIIGFIDEHDIWHSKASLINETLNGTSFNCIVFDCVINEAVSVLVKRQKERKRSGRSVNLIEKLLTYMPKENITWIYPEIERYYDEVIEAVKESRGILNFHDALIVHVAKELEISHIVSFDKDFDKTKLKRIKDDENIKIERK